jgi:hypothetical protein
MAQGRIRERAALVAALSRTPRGAAIMLALAKKYVPDWLAIILVSKLVTSYFLLA